MYARNPNDATYQLAGGRQVAALRIFQMENKELQKMENGKKENEKLKAGRWSLCGEVAALTGFQSTESTLQTHQCHTVKFQKRHLRWMKIKSGIVWSLGGSVRYKAPCSVNKYSVQCPMHEKSTVTTTLEKSSIEKRDIVLPSLLSDFSFTNRTSSMRLF